MHRSDLEDATARALEILPPDDPALADPRLLRDPQCVEEARETREAAADVWLATSPLRAAPPDVLSAVMSKVEVVTPYARKNARFFPWLAASGWVAAAVAMILWPKDRVGPPPVEVERVTTVRGPQQPARPDDRLPAKAPGSRDRQLRNELLKLQTRLAHYDEVAAATSPRVLTLSSPGGVQRTPEDARRRVWSVLTGALRSALEAESGAPDDPAGLVIERGWLPEGLTLGEGGGVIRHRNFPVDSWQQLGLLMSDEGGYYDPARQLIWAEAEDGRGFIARKATDEDDLTVFRPADESLAVIGSTPRTEPEGFLVEDPESDLAEVVIDQVPPPEEGHEQFIMWTDLAGRQNSVKVDRVEVVPTPGSAAAKEAGVVRIPASSAADGRGASTLVFSIPNSGGVKDFQLVESAIKPNGKPAKVIVSGQHPSRGSKRRN